jgi:twitching motility protein PilT
MPSTVTLLHMELTHWLAQAIAAGASDLHLSCGQTPQVRVEGRMTPLLPTALSAEDALQLHQQALTGAGLNPQLQDADFALSAPGLGRFRVNAFTHLHGPGLVLRLLPASAPPLTQLGVPASVLPWLDATGGLVLVTGPTGSGKSTTLAALVQHLNQTRDSHIITLEDPIEFIHTSQRCLIHQREIGRHTRSFESGLRAALREDPDVILVGELRDLDSIRLALTAAETGHLVLATLHTRSAAQTVSRLVDVFAAADKAMVRSQLSLSLRGVLAQQLLSSLQGPRIAVHEVLCCTPAVRHLIREDRLSQLNSAMQTGAAHGMQTLLQSIQGWVAQGRLHPKHAQAMDS